MNGFAFRIEQATMHEAAVAARLRRHGWFVGPFGQGQLIPEVRDALRKFWTPIRWMPDLIAARGHSVCLVDAKTGTDTTPNYDLEIDSVYAMLEFEGVWRLPVWYVMNDFRVISPCVVRESGRPMPGSAKGSGTPYFLIDKKFAVEFDNIFGDSPQP